ncbi:glycosyltransferase family 4 protein [Vulcanisaeta distributa]|uniref:glycosyltransferase family 4 protein n=1 Tax=Vulcanisaeta distributa TaxID=164451 RepID=UPI001FB4F59E|nr:glycosyltransferase family 4 protein [Vulcanisaeta distributa]
MLIVAWPCVHSGGAERWWYYVIRELVSVKGLKVVVVIPTNLRRGCFICPANLGRYNNIIVKYVALNGLYNFARTILELLSVIKRSEVDYVVSGYQTPSIVLLSLVLSAFTGRKCSVMFHNSFGWLPFINNIGSLSTVNKLLVKLYNIINKICRFIYVSPAIKYEHERIGLNARNINSLMGAAVEFTDLPPYRDIHERDIDIIHLASISKFKGIYDLIEILHIIRDYKHDFNAVIIGRTSKEVENEIKTLIEKYKLKDNVRFLGFVDGYVKFDLLSRSKVMIYPSYSDTFAISVLESLSVGTPVIAYSIPAISMNYRTNAVIKVRTGDWNAMAKAAVELLNDPEKISTLSHEAIKFAKRYSWHKIAIQFLKGAIEQ